MLGQVRPQGHHCEYHGDDDNSGERFVIAVAFSRLLYPRGDNRMANAVDEPAEEDRGNCSDERARVVLGENAHGEWDASWRAECWGQRSAGPAFGAGA